MGHTPHRASSSSHHVQMLSSRHARLRIAGEAWQFEPRFKASSAENASKTLLPRWLVMSSSMMTVHGWDAKSGRYWRGSFKSKGAPMSGTNLLAGVGQCDTLKVQGSITRDDGGGVLRAEVEFAMPPEAYALLWKVVLVNEGGSVEMDTITLLDGHAAPSPQEAIAPPLASTQQEKFEEVLVAVTAGWLILVSMAIRGAITYSFLGVGLCLMCVVALLAPFLIDRFGAGARKGAWVLHSILVNGWASFSFAGHIPLSQYQGVSGRVWRFLWALHLYSLQPRVQTTRTFSGAFHEGGRLPPAVWWDDFTNIIPRWVRVPLWRTRVPIFSDMFAVLASQPDDELGTGVSAGTRRRTTLVIGSLSQREQFTTVCVDPWLKSLAMHASCDRCLVDKGDSITTDWAVIHLQHGEDDTDASDPLRWYCSAVGGHCGARVSSALPTGWCSWYQFMDKVTYQNIADNADNIQELNVAGGEGPLLDVIQLDDGYARHWGDWQETNSDRFPAGLESVVKTIAAKGRTPGLWMAPLAADNQSKVVQKHPDWVLRTRRDLWPWPWPLSVLMARTPANSGYTHPGKWFCGLDITNPECRKHVAGIIAVVRDQGFRFLKLDFLHVAALPAKRYDPKVTRAQALQLALRTLREAAGDKVFFMACCCPVGTAVGLVDGMRVSADMSTSWEAWPIPWDRTNLPSVRNALRNVIARQGMHGRWFLNNPDCLVVRDASGGSQLSLSQVRGTVTTSALSGGMLFMSDDLTILSSERHQLACTLFPPVFSGCRVVGEGLSGIGVGEVLYQNMSGVEGDWTVVALCNWTGSPDARDVSMDVLGVKAGRGTVVYAFEFWSGRCSMGWAATLSNPSVDAHSASLYAVRVRKAGEVCYLGSDLHISCGCEVVGWEVGVGEVTVTLDAKRACEGCVWVFLPDGGTPSAAGTAYAGIRPVKGKREGGVVMEGAWMIRVKLDGLVGGSKLVLTWKA